MINRLGSHASPGGANATRSNAARAGSELGQQSGFFHKLEVQLTEHPKQVLAAALSIGVVVGWIIKRR
jgi:hypothetical protein